MAETTETADWKSGWTRPEVSALRDRHRPQRRAGWWPPPVPCLCLQNDLPGCQLLGDGCAPARDLLSDDSRFACLTCHVSGDPQPSLLMGTDQSRIRTEGNDGRTGRNKSSDVQDTRPALHLAARRPLSREIWDEENVEVRLQGKRRRRAHHYLIHWLSSRRARALNGQTRQAGASHLPTPVLPSMSRQISYLHRHAPTLPCQFPSPRRPQTTRQPLSITTPSSGLPKIHPRAPTTQVALA